MNAKQTNKDKIYVTTVMLGWVCGAVAYMYPRYWNVIIV